MENSLFPREIQQNNNSERWAKLLFCINHYKRSLAKEFEGDLLVISWKVTRANRKALHFQLSVWEFLANWISDQDTSA